LFLSFIQKVDLKLGFIFGLVILEFLKSFRSSDFAISLKLGSRVLFKFLIE